MPDEYSTDDNLYVGYIDDLICEVETPVAEGGTQKLPFKLSGEINLRLYPDQGAAKLERIALYGTRQDSPPSNPQKHPTDTQSNDPKQDPMDPRSVDPFGVISLSGPYADVVVDLQKPAFQNVPLRIHYRALSPTIETLLNPPGEIMAAGFSASLQETGDDGIILGDIELATQLVENLPPLEELAARYCYQPPCAVDPGAEQGEVIEIPQYDKPLDVVKTLPPEGAPAPGRPMLKSPGLVSSLRLLLPSLALARVGVAPPPPPQSGLDPCDPIDNTNPDHAKRQAPFRFVNLSSQDIQIVNQGCHAQIKEFCKIWHVKGALDVDVPIANQPNSIVVQASINDRNLYRIFGDIEALNIVIKPPAFVLGYTHVYIVDELLVNVAGFAAVVTSITYGRGEPDAIIVMASRYMLLDLRLLAHEMVHVLGLDHPSGSGSHRGQAGTIAVPPSILDETHYQQSPARNTLHNISFLVHPARNTNIKTLNIQGKWRPDP